MTTTFRLVPDRIPLDLRLDSLQAALPSSMRVIEKHDGVYVTVDSISDEDEATQALIDREVDRIQFLTYVRFRAVMCRRYVTADLTCSWRIHGPLPDAMHPISWTDSLALQFRLWVLASEANDPMIRILLHFQIIELSYPDTGDAAAYPHYERGPNPPHPRTEAKLLRNMVAHAGDAKRETGRYLTYLGLPHILGNVTHPQWVSVMKDAARRVEQEARQILHGAAHF